MFKSSFLIFIFLEDKKWRNSFFVPFAKFRILRVFGDMRSAFLVFEYDAELDFLVPNVRGWLRIDAGVWVYENAMECTQQVIK